jgi:hypothetical protein
MGLGTYSSKCNFSWYLTYWEAFLSPHKTNYVFVTLESSVLSTNAFLLHVTTESQCGDVLYRGLQFFRFQKNADF